MKGCRPLTDAELEALLASYGGRYPQRNRAFVVVGAWTGYRVSELLSMRRATVVQAGRIAAAVQVRRASMKGKTESRIVPLHPRARLALAPWLDEMDRLGWREPDRYLWQSEREGNRPISRSWAYRLIHDTARALGMDGNLGTHSLRKKFGERAREAAGGDLVTVQKLMGHADVRATARYLASFEDDAWRVLMGMAA